jgi:hypothetical protein
MVVIDIELAEYGADECTCDNEDIKEVLRGVDVEREGLVADVLETQHQEEEEDLGEQTDGDTICIG